MITKMSKNIGNIPTQDKKLQNTDIFKNLLKKMGEKEKKNIKNSNKANVIFIHDHMVLG